MTYHFSYAQKFSLLEYSLKGKAWKLSLQIEGHSEDCALMCVSLWWCVGKIFIYLKKLNLHFPPFTNLKRLWVSWILTSAQSIVITEFPTEISVGDEKHFKLLTNQKILFFLEKRLSLNIFQVHNQWFSLSLALLLATSKEETQKIKL